MRINPMRPMMAILRMARRVRFPDEGLTAAAEAAFRLASRNVGAIMLWERRDPLEPHLRSEGEIIDAEVRPALLETLFFVGAPYHDGAVYIQEDKIYRAGCVLPLSENFELAAHYGTRHRAAAGITERSDAVAVVVSEERGTVTAVEEGRIIPVASYEELAAWLNARLRGGEEDSKSRRQYLQEAIRHNWRVKLIVLAAVIALWAVAFNQRENPRDFFTTLAQGVEETFEVPVVYYNLPEGLALDKNRLNKIRVRLKGRRDVLNFLDEGKIRVSINLQNEGAGEVQRTISFRDITLPSGVHLTGAEPPQIRIQLDKIPPKPDSGM